jgi:hypothetical protein
VAIGVTTTGTNVGPSGTNYDAALIDTGLTGNGAFFTVADPRVLSKNIVRVLITLNPTPDRAKGAEVGALEGAV